MKRCTKCKKLKSKSEFSKNRKNKDGLRFWCKKCEREYKRRYYRKNRGGVKKCLRYEERHRIVSRVKQKRCSRCKKWKAESEFYKDRLRKDGLQFLCKKCSKKANQNSYKKRRLAVRN